MPLYEYRCQAGHVLDRLRRVDDRERPELCYCGYIASKVILHAPRVFGDFEGYVSPTTGRWVEGKTARREDLRESGCRPYEDGERIDAARRAQEVEKQLDQEVDSAVDVAMAALTQHDEGSDARQQLMRG